MIARGQSRFVSCRQGAAAVEFAIVALPFLLMLFGIIECGRLMWIREALQQTAIAAARCMGMTQNECGTSGVYSSAKTLVFTEAQAAKWSIALNGSNITLNAAATCGGIAGFSQVSLTYTFYAAAAPLLGALGGGAALQAAACFPNHT